MPKACKFYFSQVTFLMKISLVLPATKAVSERSTSILRRVIYKEMTGKLSFIDEAANEFSFGSDERSRLFGDFYQNFFSV